MSHKCRFLIDCVHCSNSENLEYLESMLDTAIKVTRKTFLRHVDRQNFAEFEDSLYPPQTKSTLTMASDYSVSYYRSKWNGKTCYYFLHSSIEYIFV